MAKRSVTAGNVRVSVLFGLEERILARVRTTIANFLPQLLARAKARFAGAFKKPTGRLLNSLKAVAYEGERGPRGKVFSDWYVTSFYEFGYGGKPAKVKSHERESPPSRHSKAGRHKVRAHQRNIPKHPGRWLMKAALDEMSAPIRGALEVAVRKGN